ncbi:FAD-binding oxidoreductase [Belnapia sp. T6]|uniref:FAD-binding oxidoreductase n=1 Tax=Belnapia mucosa TaxID=2804532 RepID=A0ABS1V1Y6_9PROT|nr:FAD-dependent oxidoreductase [Belnapia mucosa]MBL6455287.1 FAD-binding oxidoreductase [Belnapia mucosa]
MQTIVIGAGVLGAAIAFRLAQAGAQVTVLEAGRVGGGTSGTSFAWINSATGGVPPAYHALRIASMQAHAEVAAEFGGASWYHPTGGLKWAWPAELPALEANVAALQARGYAAEWIDRARLLAMEPDLDPVAIGDGPIAWFPEEGWLDPVPYAGAMVRAAQSLGAVLRTGARVAGMEMAGGRVTGVRLADGTRLAADCVVNCAGRWSDGLRPVPHVPLAPTVGFLVFTPPVAAGISHVLHAPEANLRPDGAGRLMLVWNDFAAGFSAETPPDPRLPEVQEMMQSVSRLIPSLAGLEAEAVRIGVRPLPRDGLSAIGPVPRTEGYYVAVTHSGVTLSPILARLVAAEVVRGEDRAELAEFRPARFFN